MTQRLPINIRDKFRSITGREPTPDDYAIFEQIFVTERGEIGEPMNDTSLISIENQYMNQFNRAMRLNRQEGDIELRSIVENPRLYRLLLYYHLLSINSSMVESGWIRDIAPRYSSKKMGVSTDMSILNRDQYLNWLQKSNDRYDRYLGTRSTSLSTDPRFPTRLIYTPLISSQLRKHPLSLDIHMTIEEMLQHESMEYVSISDDSNIDRMSLDDMHRELNGITFYHDIYDVPTPEVIIEAQLFEGEGSYGTTFVARLGGDIPMFMKYNRTPEESIHEYRVGIELNPYYSECPFFMYTYGISNLMMNSAQMVQYQAVLDNQSDHLIMGDRYHTVAFNQWIPDSISLIEFMSNGFDDDSETFMLRGDKIEMVEHSVAIQQILMAILCTLKFLWDKIGFIHGDLHLVNIQVIRFDTPQILPLPGYPGRVFNLSAVPVLIDYGFSSVLRPQFSHISSTILPTTEIATVSPVDDRIVTEHTYVSDIFKLLRYMMIANGIYESDVEELIANTYYHAFTGHQPESEFASRLIRDVLSERLGHGSIHIEEFRNRMMPLGMNSYDPDGAIDEFVKKAYIDTGVKLPESIDQSIDELINDRIDTDGLTISTYAGSVIYELYRDEISLEPSYSPLVHISMNELREILEVFYNQVMRIIDVRLEQLGDSQSNASLRAGFNRLKTRMTIMYVYRNQINQLISNTIPT